MKRPTPRARGSREPVSQPHTDTGTQRGSPLLPQKRKRRIPHTRGWVSRPGDAVKLAASVAARVRAGSSCAVAPCRPPPTAVGICRRRAAGGISPTRGPRARNAHCLLLHSLRFRGLWVGLSPEQCRCRSSSSSSLVDLAELSVVYKIFSEVLVGDFLLGLGLAS